MADLKPKLARLAAGVVLLFLAACKAQTSQASPTPDPQGTATTPSVDLAAPTRDAQQTPATSPPAPTQTLTPRATLALFDPANPPQVESVSLEDITSFAELPNNSAQGEPAPEFSARLLGGERFTLSEKRGATWLVLPTALGCGECMYSLTLLSQAQPANRESLNVLVLDIYQPDSPEYWQSYLETFGQPGYAWGVVDSPDFLEDYEIYGLGSFLVIDPGGRLVFRSDSPPRIEMISHMFTLAEGLKAE